MRATASRERSAFPHGCRGTPGSERPDRLRRAWYGAGLSSCAAKRRGPCGKGYTGMHPASGMPCATEAEAQQAGYRKGKDFHEGTKRMGREDNVSPAPLCYLYVTYTRFSSVSYTAIFWF